MSNVLEFPDTGVRAWSVLERGMSRILVEEEGYPAAEVAQALAVLRPVYLQYAHTERCDSLDGLTGEQAVQAVNSWATRIFTGLTGEVLRREMELCRLRGPSV